MIEYNKLFALLESRNMKRTDLLKIISSSTLAKIGKNQTITTDTIDKLCLYLDVQPNSIMEVYELNDQGEKIVFQSPDADYKPVRDVITLALSEWTKYVKEDGTIDYERLQTRVKTINDYSKTL